MLSQMTRLSLSLTTLFFSIFPSCASGQKAAVQLNPQEFLTAVDSAKATPEGIQLIDVRRPAEFNEGHVPGAQLINWFDQDFSDQVQSLDKNRPVYLYCRSGNRSGKAAQVLLKHGFDQLYELEGGMLAWSREGLPREQ